MLLCQFLNEGTVLSFQDFSDKKRHLQKNHNSVAEHIFHMQKITHSILEYANRTRKVLHIKPWKSHCQSNDIMLDRPMVCLSIK